MPIANCLVRDIEVDPVLWEKITTDLATLIKLSTDDITLNVSVNGMQFGKKYRVMVHLYLPTIWNALDIEMIENSLYKALQTNLSTRPDEIFIMTSLIEPGHVVENGKIIWW